MFAHLRSIYVFASVTLKIGSLGHNDKIRAATKFDGVASATLIVGSSRWGVAIRTTGVFGVETSAYKLTSSKFLAKGRSDVIRTVPSRTRFLLDIF